MTQHRRPDPSTRPDLVEPPCRLEAAEITGATQEILRLASGNDRVTLVQIAGLRGGEGASSVAWSLAHALAERAGVGVALITTDDAEPPSPGALDIDGLDAAAAGSRRFPRPEDGATVPVIHGRFSGRSRLRALGGGLKNELAGLPSGVRVALLDSAPFTVGVDAAAFARQVDGVILVLEAERSRLNEAAAARDAVERAGGQLLGFVLNKRRRRVPALIARLLGLPNRGGALITPGVLLRLLGLTLLAALLLGGLLLLSPAGQRAIEETEDRIGPIESHAPAIFTEPGT